MNTLLGGVATLAATVVLGASAMAADLAVKAPVYKAPPPAIYSWGGCYLGADVGYAWERDKLTESSRATGAISPFNPASPAKPDGVKGGGYIGCNWQWSGPWVVGIEGDAEGAGLKGSGYYTNTGLPPDFWESSTRFEGSVRGRVGYAVDRVLFYATGGVAFANVRERYVVGATPGINESFTTTRAGWTAGAGIDYAITNNWIGRIEYRHADFGKITDLPLVTFAAFTEHHRIDEDVVRVGLSYKFGGAIVARY